MHTQHTLTALVLVLGSSAALAGPLEDMRARDAAAERMTLRATVSADSVRIDPTQGRATREVVYIRDGEREALSWIATHPDPTYRAPGDRHYSGDFGPSGELIVWQTVRFDGVRAPNSSVTVQVHQRIDVFPDGSLVRHPEHLTRTTFAPGALDSVWLGRECLLALGVGVTEHLAEPLTVEVQGQTTWIRAADATNPTLEWAIVVSEERPTISMCVFLNDHARRNQTTGTVLVCHIPPLIGVSTIGEVIVGEYSLPKSGWVDRVGMSRVMAELGDARFEADHEVFEAIAAHVAGAEAQEEVSADGERRLVE
ncbi:MAG: hypothetical protein IBJ10_04445 [Phycisphaerales bacterium]|nr:hypothetical protein [Phycisphaerales bacterium]